MRLLASAIGLLIAALALDDFTITAQGFISTVVVFAATTIIFEPLLLKTAIQYLSALRVGIALVSTFVGLLFTATFTGGLEIRGVETWLLAPFIVWLSVLAMSVLLPLVIFKKLLNDTSDRRG